MSSYKISPTLNPNKVFLIKYSELEKRLDPFFYIPTLMELEKKVLMKQPKRLRYYVKSISSGATPKTTEYDLYYSDKENGIPFLRVQNLSPTGVLEFEDCKYINQETHNGMLKRSQVSAGDLLIKITGVGRMAVASVVPEGFEGNINQHVCVIKTGSKEISETLAAYLNSDIGESLASRRSTGGTRPALDYPALLSIPIIEDKRILEVTKKVLEQKQQNEAEAESLLASIDTYLLNELGIELPKETYYAQANDFTNISEPEENYGHHIHLKEEFKLNEQSKLVQQGRIFITKFSEVTGDRFDSYFHQKRFKNNIEAILKSNYPTVPLSELINGSLIKGTLPKQEEKQGTNSVVQINCIKADGSIILEDLLTAKDIFTKEQKLKRDDILIVITGATIGKIAYWNYEGDYYLGGDIVKFQTNTLAENSFVYNFLLSAPIQIEIKRQITGATNGHLSPDDIKKIPIPLPPLEKQKEIAEHITAIRKQAQELKDKTKEALAKASEEIEKILIG